MARSSCYGYNMLAVATHARIVNKLRFFGSVGLQEGSSEQVTMSPSHIILQEKESGKKFQWQKIGYNQVKYRWRKLTNNPKQGLDRIHHCAKKQDPV